MILPGATLGILGGGQLGRMFVHAATAMGYRVIVLDPNSSSPAGEIAHLHLQAKYDDAHSLKALAQECAVITTEFENVPADVFERLENTCQVSPSARVLDLAQDRIKEKQFSESLSISPTPFYAVSNEEDIQQAFATLEAPLILKTTRLGYDGKGQAVVNSTNECVEKWNELERVDCILEKKIDLASEVSVVLARSSDKELSFFPVAENVHRDGILFTSTVPANVEKSIQNLAKSHAQKIAEELDYCGVLAVEYFIDTDGNLYFNEMAPRTHNSGHYSMDACYTSQFEQQVRAICGLPLGDTSAHSAVTMVNILGDLWNAKDQQPDWTRILSENVKLHLYGKHQARPGRKMGHFNYLAQSNNDLGEDTLAQAKKLFLKLTVE
ncbi:MAG: 5-(carboxyamino)imidazole ribonucleotide synthase [Gammaproteobacteria bacterium]